jgi:hypothetical protein
LDAFRRAKELNAAQNATAKSGAAATPAVSQAEVASPSPEPIAPQEPAATPRTRIYGNK